MQKLKNGCNVVNFDKLFLHWFSSKICEFALHWSKLSICYIPGCEDFLNVSFSGVRRRQRRGRIIGVSTLPPPSWLIACTESNQRCTNITSVIGHFQLTWFWRSTRNSTFESTKRRRVPLPNQNFYSEILISRVAKCHGNYEYILVKNFCRLGYKVWENMQFCKIKPFWKELCNFNMQAFQAKLAQFDRVVNIYPPKSYF